MTLISSITKMGSVQQPNSSSTTKFGTSTSYSAMQGANETESLINLNILASILGLIGIKICASVL
ncbi:hypothetical protein SAMD00019534_099750, partial [Acytostelium subglobosum LB1]|uniref:hypothetical protein n=1 Tax=Acytostelium subglobosum LB1 TaxID=1410327 RepID=UPI000644E5AB